MLRRADLGNLDSLLAGLEHMFFADDVNRRLAWRTREFVGSQRPCNAQLGLYCGFRMSCRPNFRALRHGVAYARDMVLMKMSRDQLDGFVGCDRTDRLEYAN